MIRRAAFADAHNMSLLAARLPPTKTSFLNRYCNLLVPSTIVQPYAGRIQRHMLNPRSVGFVAVLEADPMEIVGYLVATRHGAHEHEQRSPGLWILFAWAWSLWMWIAAYTIGGGERDSEADLELELRRWKPWPTRWHVDRLFVRHKWRRKGVGTKLMTKIIENAVTDKIPLLLEATPRGKKLYTKLGFLVLEEQREDYPKHSGVGMIWTLDDQYRV
jgi:GNAT superfamily N-acetyltransferase